MDDLVILSNDKQYLHNLLKEISDYFDKKLNLQVKGNYQIFLVDKEGIDFVGYRHFRKYILLRKTTAKNLIRKMRDINNKIESGKNINYTDYCSINSYKGWLEWCNGYNLYIKWIKPLEPYAKQYYKEVIKHENKRDAKKD